MNPTDPLTITALSGGIALIVIALTELVIRMERR